MIALACDHGALELKEAIKKHLEKLGLAYRDFGTDSKDSCDYPDFAGPAAKAVASGACEKGIVCCTTGIGVSIVANKVPGVRCALLHDHMSARLTRQHNDANMMALGAAICSPMMAMELIDIFLNTEFQGGRHQRRVDKITALEQAR
ncbi:MAG: ribose 5-phosphate isomerase B [Oscillospiraceae bacterium]|nr:ribose 5-phosphate isomerase B [Oscillospiraceae bacterium]